MKLLRHLCVLSFCLAVNHAFALPDFDPFADVSSSGGSSYPVGSPLAGQTDSAGHAWNLLGSNNTNGTQPMIVGGNLSYSNFPAATGNSISLVPSAGMSARLTLSSTAITAAYYSFLLKVTDISTVSTNAANNFIACFSDTTGAQAGTLSRAGARLLTKKTDGGYLLGISKTSATADYVYDTTVRSVNEVVLVVAGYERVGGVTNVSLWVNPPASSFGSPTPPAPTVTTTSGSTGDINANAIRAFLLLCQFAGGPAAIVDELRIANNWAYVTGGDPAIVELPASQSRPPGEVVTLNVVASGTPPLTYQWMKDGGLLTDGGIITGTTTSTLTLSGITLGDAGNYFVIVTNGLGNSVTSAPAVLTIADPVVTSEPQNRTNDFGTLATFNVSAGGTDPLSYRWQKDGVELSHGGAISGATTDTLSINAVSYLDAGNYIVVVTNGSGNTATSSPGILTVRDPIITSPPASDTKVTGTMTTFTVSAAGSPALSYQWRHGNSNVVDGGFITGAQSEALTISSVAPTNAGNYTVIVTGSASGQSVTSSPALLTVIDPIAITSQPASRTFAIGASAAFAVGVTGTSPAYQWRRNGLDIPGASSSAYVMTNIQFTNAGSFTVMISNTLNVVTSAPGALTVVAQVNLHPTNLVVLRGGDGAQALANAGSPIFLDQFTTNGTYVNTVWLPDSGASAFIQNGTSATEGFLNLSMDRRLLTLAGYNYPRPHTGNLGNASSTIVPRAIATVDGSGQFNLAITSTNAFDQSNIRSAVTDGTNNFWVAGGATGTRYFGPAGTNVQVQSTIANTRMVQIVNGELYFSAASVSWGIHKMTGLPTVLTTETNILPTGNSQSSTFDFAISPDGTNIYTTEDASANTNIYVPGIIKWTYDNNSSMWVSNYTLLAGTATRGMTVNFDAEPPVIYTTTTNGGNDAGNRLLAVQDTGPTALPTTLATAGPHQAFRGVRFGPLEAVASPTIASAFDGTNLILHWIAPGFVLVSSTNVAGPYDEVIGATSPHTNNTSSASARFFRLRK